MCPISRRHRPDRAARQRGATMIVALIFTFVLLTMGGALLQFAVQEGKSTHVSRESAAALCAAEAGLEKAMDILQRRVTSSGSYGAFDPAVGLCFTGYDMSVSVSLDGKSATASKTGVAPVEYALSTDVTGAEGTFTVDTEPGGPGWTGRRKIEATGYFPNKAAVDAGKGVSRTVVAWIAPGATGFPNAAIIARKDVQFGGKKTGPDTVAYDPDTDSFFTSTKHHADVVSTEGDVTSSANGLEVDGSVYAASGISNKVVARGPDMLVDPDLTKRYSWPTVETTGDPTNNPPPGTWFGDWKAEAMQQMQIAGTYGPGSTLYSGYYPGDVELNNSAKLSTPGPVSARSTGSTKIIYIDGDLTVQAVDLVNEDCFIVVRGNVEIAANSGFSVAGDPKEYGLVAWGDITLQGTPTADGSPVGIGAVYAVNGSVTLQGNALMVGALIAGGTSNPGVSINTSNNGGLKYPEGLVPNMNFLPGTPVILAWQEK